MTLRVPVPRKNAPFGFHLKQPRKRRASGVGQLYMNSALGSFYQPDPNYAASGNFAGATGAVQSGFGSYYGPMRFPLPQVGLFVRGLSAYFPSVSVPVAPAAPAPSPWGEDSSTIGGITQTNVAWAAEAAAAVFFLAWLSCGSKKR